MGMARFGLRNVVRSKLRLAVVALALSISSTLGPTAMGLLLAVAIMVAAAGSAYALRQIVRLSPLEAIRNE